MMGRESTSPQAFLVVGAMKSGTTSLSSLLSDHPEVELVTEKESSSFLSASTAAQAAEKISASRAKAAGEISTAYTQMPLIKCDPRIAREAVGADLKIIAVLREPYSRATSHWRHWEQLGRNPEGTMQDLLIQQDQPYAQFSSYYSQLVPWVETFGKDNVLPLKLEDYEKAASNWTGPLSEFLGISVNGFDSDSIRKENAGDSRVVSRGVGSKIRELGIYQKFLRPLVPASARRRAALFLGGNKGGHETAAVGDETKVAFLSAISSDTQRLQTAWPHLTWITNEEKPT